MDFELEAIEILVREIGMLRKLNRMCRDAMQKNDERARVLALAHIEQSIRGGTPW